MKPIAGGSATKIAERLLLRFGSIGGVMAAPSLAISECAEPGETWHESLISTRALFLMGLEAGVSRSNLDSSDARFRLWLRSQFTGLSEERLLGVFGDGAGRFIAYKWLALGGESMVQASARTIIQSAFDLKARSVILAHNHPSGNASASEDDIRSTINLQSLARPLGIEIRDHIILADANVCSMADRGIL
ncbi:JAB domain-containing protein [Qipengyuania sp. RANM35]|uniref:JAB domain-containing protein n=1 Tax=Qipengyuania sp. RANM35 TaxID=3068635 RepID=UPI0034DB6D32